MSWSALDWGILGPALIAGLLVLSTHVPLGMQVLDRGIVFIDLAIAQIAGLGVIAADAFGLPEGGVGDLAAAVFNEFAPRMLFPVPEGPGRFFEDLHDPSLLRRGQVFGIHL